MSVKMRQEVERKVVSAFVRQALKSGYSLSVSLERGYDHDVMAENGVLGSTNYRKIMDEAFAGDDCHIFVHSPGVGPLYNGAINCAGWVYLVFGNDGYDVISDYTLNMESLGLLKNAEKVAARYE